jgi:hypothetical protein
MQGTHTQIDPGPVTARRGTGAALVGADAWPRFGRSDIRRRLKPLTFMSGPDVRSMSGFEGRENDPPVEHSRPLAAPSARADADRHCQPLDRLP